MNTIWNTKQAAAIFGKVEQTIRNWAEEFTDYLSPTANPGEGRNRLFTVEDMAVLAFIAESQKAGHTFPDIHAGLHNGQRGTPPEIPPDTLATLMSSNQEQALAQQVEYYQQMYEVVSRERNFFIEQIKDLKAHETDNIRLKEEVRQLTLQKAEYEKRLEEEYKKGVEMGRAQGELEALRRLIEERKSGS